MVEQTPQPLEVRERDGTSQADRIRAALDPPYAAIDERTIQDLLAYTHAFATNLNFYEVVTREGIEQLSATGTWQNFLGDDFDLDAAVAFIEDPNSVTDAEAAILSRPHVALFLAFLKLLQRAQGQLNRFTQRHLEYYYQDVLRLTKRDATPGNVIVLAELAPTVDENWMPAVTPLDAG